MAGSSLTCKVLVILLELICCRQNVELEAAEEDRKILTDWANDCYRCGRVDLLVEGDDEAIFDLKKVERFVTVALWCLQEDPTMRPGMLKVTQMLDEAAAVPSPPDASSFVTSLPSEGGRNVCGSGTVVSPGGPNYQTYNAGSDTNA
jgi:hypothetical protein